MTALYLRGRSDWWIAAAVGWPLALATGYFRIAADKHYATDVLTGMALGAAAGAATVWFHKTDSAGSAQANLTAIPTRVEAIAAAAKRPRVLVNASAQGYYGDRGDEEIDESSAPGSDFLLLGNFKLRFHSARRVAARPAMVRLA